MSQRGERSSVLLFLCVSDCLSTSSSSLASAKQSHIRFNIPPFVQSGFYLNAPGCVDSARQTMAPYSLHEAAVIVGTYAITVPRVSYLLFMPPSKEKASFSAARSSPKKRRTQPTIRNIQKETTCTLFKRVHFIATAKPFAKPTKWSAKSQSCPTTEPSRSDTRSPTGITARATPLNR